MIDFCTSNFEVTFEIERFYLALESQQRHLNMSKQYGLILSKNTSKKKPVSSAFNEDSSDEDEETKAIVSGGTDWMKRKLASGSSQNAKSGATGRGTKLKAQTKLEMQRAMEEDPTVFQYDEVYDKMEADKVEQMSKKKDKDRKPRYIANLLKQAEVRTKENERRIERQVQKEREAEGDEFADKEKFVTSAYRKKMEEMEQLEEEERKKDAIEKMLDVTKQKDMSGFYRHLYRQTMGEEKGQSSASSKEIVLDDKDEENTSTNDNTELKMTKKSKPSQRSYRRRDEEGEKDHDKASQSSSCESSSASSAEDDEKESQANEETEKRRMENDKLRREELRKQREKRERRKRRIEEGRDTSSESEEEVDDASGGAMNQELKEEDPTKKSCPDEESRTRKPKEPKRDIWKKVTVGELFEAALQRYLIRKAERGSRFPW